MPNDPASMPDGPASMPDGPGSMPDGPGSMLNDPGSMPDGPGSMPDDPGSMPNDPGSMPDDPGSMLNDPGWTPGGRGWFPNDRAWRPGVAAGRGFAPTSAVRHAPKRHHLPEDFALRVSPMLVGFSPVTKPIYARRRVPVQTRLAAVIAAGWLTAASPYNGLAATPATAVPGAATPTAGAASADAGFPARPPAQKPLDAAKLAEADQAIQKTIDAGDIPGAVLIVGRGDRTGGQVLYHRAFGKRALQPEPKPMTLDTIFDLASLSKSVGCASSVMVLVEQGKIKPQEKVATYLPEFGKNGKEAITVAHLLLHQGGLIPDNSIKDYDAGPAAAWEKICDLKVQTPPGTAFKYTDVGFITLGKLVEKVSGQPLDQFAAEHVFGPAGMADTGYHPTAGNPSVNGPTAGAWAAKLAERAAPTEKRDGRWMIGNVHDPRAFALGGVAGHAGVFSTAADVGRFCRMLLNGGTIDGRQVLKPATVAEMTQPRPLAVEKVGRREGGPAVRTYGFDVDTGYSSPRGERFDRGTTFGHTGFTGTSLWVDPVNDCYVVLLTNSVHPDGKGHATPLRRLVGTIAAEALLGPAPATQPAATTQAAATQAAAAQAAATQPFVGPVATGLDALVAQNFKSLHGKRVALVTNHSGLDQQGRRILDLLIADKDVKVVKVFSPEHGLYGALDEHVSDTVDPKTGLKVFSLYGKIRKPTPAMMEGVDVVLFDMQDAGARYYTYVATMGLCMEAAAEAKVKMMVLDRPNPLGGHLVDGPLADAKDQGFTAFGSMPVSHGMTIGELARMFNVEKKIGCDLEVVPMQGWSRSMWFDETGLLWVNPSPNLRNSTQALLYLGVGQIEFSNVSVGRGTDQPFEMLGAPWIDARRLAAALNAEKLPGLRFVPIHFTPTSSKFEGKECHGVYIAVTERAAVQPVKLGTALAWHLKTLGGEQYELANVNKLVKNAATMEKLKTAKAPAEVWASWDKDLEGFRATRAKYLMYK
jgi:uncharacterized protein YbbC (DUF1343 family)/CubicO group peptidase (beta-lactamase class C family)